MDQTIPTWGYKPDGSAEIFHLAPGEGLPEGWEASPSCIVDQNFATADALTARAEGRPYSDAVIDAVSGFRVDRPELDAPAMSVDLANALAEIDRLTGIISAGTEENQRLVGEIEDAEAGLEAAAGEIVSLKGLLSKAQEDGGFAVAERDELNAKLEAMATDLAAVRADLDLATAPKPAAKAGK